MKAVKLWSVLLPVALTMWTLLFGDTVAMAEKSAQTVSPQQDYTGDRSKPVEYEVDFSVVVTPPYHANVLKVWLPLPQNNAGQEIRDRQISTFPMKVEAEIATESVFGNQFAYFEFHQPKGAQIIRHRFIAKVWEMTWDVSPERIRLPHQWPSSLAAYLRDVDGLAQRDDFRTILEDIGANQPLPANALFAWMTIHEYQPDRPVTYPFKDFNSLEDVDSLDAESD